MEEAIRIKPHYFIYGLTAYGTRRLRMREVGVARYLGESS